MIGKREGIQSQEVALGTEAVLFVEGETGDSFDVDTLRILLDEQLSIRALGPSYSVKSVAQALHPHHPAYYFLVDRDAHHTDDSVEQSWKNFPDEATHNLLIWRRRELENYFLEPQYLVCSSFCTSSEESLTEKLIDLVRQRLYMDVANHVLVSIRESQKSNWISLFTDPHEFSSAEIAMEKLVARPEFSRRRDEVHSSVELPNIEGLFTACLARMTGDNSQLALGTGNWLEMTQGKKVLSQLVNSSLFDVRDNRGNALQGRVKLREVVRDLLRQGTNISQPSDFTELKGLIENRVREV